MTEPVKELRPCLLCGTIPNIFTSKAMEEEETISCSGGCAVTGWMTAAQWNDAWGWQQSDRDKELILELLNYVKAWANFSNGEPIAKELVAKVEERLAKDALKKTGEE